MHIAMERKLISTNFGDKNMLQYVRCAKTDGRVIGNTFEVAPVNLPHTAVFWVKVTAVNPDGSFVYPASFGEGDSVSFVLNTQLTAEEMVAQNLIKDEASGSWQHAISQETAQQNMLQSLLRTIDNETYYLIRDWCRTQPEGCEEAFISIGIHDKNNPRYLAYMEQKNTIKDVQTQKKAQLIQG